MFLSSKFLISSSNSHKYIFHMEFPISTLRLDDIPNGKVARASKQKKQKIQSLVSKFPQVPNHLKSMLRLMMKNMNGCWI